MHRNHVFQCLLLCDWHCAAAASFNSCDCKTDFHRHCHHHSPIDLYFCFCYCCYSPDKPCFNDTWWDHTTFQVTTWLVKNSILVEGCAHVHKTPWQPRHWTRHVDYELEGCYWLYLGQFWGGRCCLFCCILFYHHVLLGHILLGHSLFVFNISGTPDYSA